MAGPWRIHLRGASRSVCSVGADALASKLAPTLDLWAVQMPVGASLLAMAAPRYPFIHTNLLKTKQALG